MDHIEITLTRNEGWYGRFRNAQIMADKTQIGRIKSGQTIVVQVPQSAENLFAKMDWGWSPPYAIKDLRAGQTLYVNARFTLNPLKSLGITSIPITLAVEPA